MIGLLQLTRTLLVCAAILAIGFSVGGIGFSFGARLFPVLLPDTEQLIIDRSSFLAWWAFGAAIILCLGASVANWWLSTVEAH